MATARLSFIILLVLTQFACRVRQPVGKAEAELILLDSMYTGRVPEIDALISPYTSLLEKEMNDTIGYTRVEFVKARPEGPLGNLAACLVYSKAVEIEPDLEMVILNHGGFRAPLPKGVITTRHLFELMPFDNQLVILEFPAIYLPDLAGHIASVGGDPVCFRQGAYLEIDEDSGSFINLRTGRDKHTVLIATSDYLVNGGDNYSLFAKALSKRETSLLIRDILIEKFAEQYPAPDQAAEPTLDGRIRKKESR